MLKKVRITTHLLTVTENGEETITTESQGGCLIEETGIVLRYPEAENRGTAMLVAGTELAQLRRQGDIRTRMTFIEGKLLPMDYATPQAKLDFSLYTHRHELVVDAVGGRLDVRYTLLLAGVQVADNTLTIQWNFL